MANQRRTWTVSDLNNLRDFVLFKESELKRNFYLNILENNLKHRKSFHFFNEMSKFVGRTIPECKSKFQKYEKTIYEDYLSIPSSYFQVFIFLRNKRKIMNKKSKKISNESSLELITPLDEYLKISKIRKNIIELIFTKKLNSFLDNKTIGTFYINLIVRKI